MRSADKARQFDGARRRCSCCVLRLRCLPTDLDEGQTLEFEKALVRSRNLAAGEHLFRVGDPFQTLYPIHSGCFKSYTVDADGREQVVNFHFAGEIMGPDAIYPEMHLSNGVALTDSSVCYLPYKTILEVALEMPAVQAQLMRMMSREVLGLTSISGDFTAEERLAAFLVMVSARLRTHGQAPTDIRLAMSRQDIANYLRLATETVSRILARFQKKGLVKADRKHITLLDPDGLREIGECMNPWAHYPGSL